MTLLYGIMIIFLLGGSAALSMAEVASIYPTAGGQYHWTSILSPDSVSRGLVGRSSTSATSSGRLLTISKSYWCGILNTFGWIASVGGFIAPFPTIVLAMVSFWQPDYVLESWHVFLIYQALNFLMTAYNIFLLKRTVWVMNVGCKFSFFFFFPFFVKQVSFVHDNPRASKITNGKPTRIVFMSIIAFFVFTITCIAESNPKQSNQVVWTTFKNTSGWSSDAIVFLTGLVNPNFIYSGLDGAIHLAEECTNAAVAVPRALMSTVVIGFATGLAFAITMCYSYHDFDSVLASA